MAIRPSEAVDKKFQTINWFNGAISLQALLEQGVTDKLNWNTMINLSIGYIVYSTLILEL
jgi:hypothetical protein